MRSPLAIQKAVVGKISRALNAYTRKTHNGTRAISTSIIAQHSAKQHFHTQGPDLSIPTYIRGELEQKMIRAKKIAHLFNSL